jgi:cytochrome c553
MNELKQRYIELILKAQGMVLARVKTPPFCPRPKGLSEDEINELAALFAEIQFEAPWLLAREASA